MPVKLFTLAEISFETFLEVMSTGFDGLFFVAGMEDSGAFSLMMLATGTSSFTDMTTDHFPCSNP